MNSEKNTGQHSIILWGYLSLFLCSKTNKTWRNLQPVTWQAFKGLLSVGDSCFGQGIDLTFLLNTVLHISNIV